MSKKRLYIAYGSNLNLPQMAHRCPTARPVGTAELKNHELLFRGARRSGVATVEPREGFGVPVLVWALKPRDERALDRYEGYPTLYGKRMLDIEVNGKTVPAMIYVLAQGHDAGFPSEYYLDVIAQGYRSVGFDLGILNAAVNRTEEIMAEETERTAAEPDRNEDYDRSNLFGLKWR
jgi:hypothetical protein